MKRALVAIGFAIACNPMHEPCSEADLSKIVAAHEARLAAACYGQGPDCEGRKAEDVRFESELKTWVRCDHD